jgi:3-hydroxyacyl-CoA dehydrogenase
MHPESLEKVKPLIEEFRKKMREKGYTESQIDKALERAYGYCEGVAMFADSKNPELVKTIEVEIFPEALEHSEKWLEKLIAAITR